MTGFIERDGVLHAEGVPLTTVAEAVGTPLYCYSTAVLVDRYRAFAAAFAAPGTASAPASGTTICYALKANANLAVVRTLARLGAGADVVSEGELRRALAAGIPAERMVFSGVGKTEAELAAALDAGIGQFNIESPSELETLSALAAARGIRAPLAIRVNPDVDAGTHAKITTGRKENKFGIDIEDAPALFRHAAALPGLDPVGVAVHIGSQLTRLAPFRAAYRRVAELIRALRADGLAVPRLDLGGGLGITYRDEQPPAPADYAALVRETVGGLGCHLTLEPGRALAGPAGILLSRVVTVKAGRARSFVILDAAMNDLIRPALYDAWHPIRPVRSPPPGAPLVEVDVVGPVCESGDTFARGRLLPPLAPGDLVAIGAAGAYGAVMASSYNSRPLVPEVLVDGAAFAVVRKRPTFVETLRDEALPPWLAEPALETAGL